MLREFEENGVVLVKTGKGQTKSPSRRAQDRRSSSQSAMGPASVDAEKTNELRAYLNAMNLDELEYMTRKRKSTKNLEGGPMIVGRMGDLGKSKLGYSVPPSVLNRELEFGKPSYHKGELSNVKKVLANEGTRENLINNIQRFLADEVIQEAQDMRRRARGKERASRNVSSSEVQSLANSERKHPNFGSRA